MHLHKVKQAPPIVAARPSSNRGEIKDLALKEVNLRRELLYSGIAVAVTVIATLLLYKDIFAVVRESVHSRQWGHLAQRLVVRRRVSGTYLR